MLKVLLPWKLESYKLINGYHPLLASFVDACPDGMEFVVPDDSSTFGDEEVKRVTFEYIRETLLFGGLAAAGNADVTKWVNGLMFSRNPADQMRIESYAGKVDVVFHHTAPVHLSTIPFVLHFESLTTLFCPYLSMGETRDVNLREQAAFGLVKRTLESDACRGVFTHLKGSRDALVKSFASDKIAEKTQYVPLGVTAPVDFEERIVQKIQGIPQRRGLNILFTNSAHARVGNFFLRGGVELLLAFQRLLESAPDATLTIVSKRPPFELFQNLNMRNVVWIEEPIDDAKLYELLLDADVFALPAAGLHSYSALRALKFGAVLICSDAPGYDEYVVDGETGIVVPGRLAQIYQPDPETGWMRDDYSSALTWQPPIAERLGDALERLAANPEERHRIAAAAYDHVARHHAMGPWVQGIAAMLGA
ncbi:glycosyltransferase family 4 protein [Azospirillum sp.]|uniref:glycosyltransferase family 4 protein n=1 Tax=Azospirillum sp. TaxID=34012 RepID=UPI003D72AC7A